MGRYIKVLLLVMVGVLLVGCNEEKELVMQAKADFKILYDYEEDRIRPVLEGEVTPEELARKYLLTRLELEEDEPTYKERGVMEDQGIFIESAILDGGTIPNVTPMSKKEFEEMNDTVDHRTEKEKLEEFKELKSIREKVIGRQYDTDNTGAKDIEEEIKRKVKQYEQDTLELEDGTDFELDLGIEGDE